MNAFLDGLGQARQAGRDLSGIASVASFFVSRVDTEVDARLDKIGTPEAAALRGRAAIANARLAYRHYERMLASPRWAALAAAGARPQRPLTDARLRTSDPDIYAAGDVANAYHPLLGRHIRVEHWANALNQPQAAARAMLGGDGVYDRVPYFYTDQYDLGMEYAGYVEPGGYDQIVFRGDVGRREFIAFWLGGGRVLAGMNVNIWDVSEVIQAMVRGGRTVDPGRLADPSVPLEEFTAG